MLDLFKEIDIKKYIESKYRKLNFDLRIRSSDETIMIYVPSEQVSQKVDKEHTSLRQLNFLKKIVHEKFERPAEIILLQDDSHAGLEEGFLQILNRKFNDNVVSLYLSFKSKSVIDIFIEVSNLDRELKKNVLAHLVKIANDANLRVGHIQWLDSPFSLPNFMVLLRAIKILQPIKFNDLLHQLQQEFIPITDNWLGNKLDSLRRKGLIIRQNEDETYLLSQSGLGIVPSGTRRSSSDINRALELSKKKWSNEK